MEIKYLLISIYHPIFITHIDIHAVRFTFLVNLKDRDNKVHYGEINGQGPVELTLMITIHDAGSAHKLFTGSGVIYKVNYDILPCYYYFLVTPKIIVYVLNAMDHCQNKS